MPPSRRTSSQASRRSSPGVAAGILDDDGVISHEEAAQLVELWQDLLAQEAKQEDELEKLKRAMFARRDANACLRWLGNIDRRIRRHIHRLIKRQLEYGGAVVIQSQWMQLKELRAAQAEGGAANDFAAGLSERDERARQNFVPLFQSRLRLRRALSKMMNRRMEVAAEALSLFEGAVRPMAARKTQLKGKLKSSNQAMHGGDPSKMPRMHPALQTIREAQEELIDLERSLKALEATYAQYFLQAKLKGEVGATFMKHMGAHMGAAAPATAEGMADMLLGTPGAMSELLLAQATHNLAGSSPSHGPGWAKKAQKRLMHEENKKKAESRRKQVAPPFAGLGGA